MSEARRNGIQEREKKDIPIHAFEIGGFDLSFFLMALSGFPRAESCALANLALAFRCWGVCAWKKRMLLACCEDECIQELCFTIVKEVSRQSKKRRKGEIKMIDGWDVRYNPLGAKLATRTDGNV